jgi:hypothetical protein
MNYYDTLIEVADDCPATEGLVPAARGGKKTKAVVEYELLVTIPTLTPKKRSPSRCTPCCTASRKEAGRRNVRRS